MKLFKSIYLLPLLLLTMLTACSDTIVDEGGNTAGGNSDAQGNVTFNICTTRGVQTSATDDAELIQSYVIVVAQEGKVVKVLTKESLPAAEMHAVKASLIAGNYKVYAFANIPSTSQWLSGKFVVGQALPDVSTLYYGDASFRNGMTGLIPMSNSVDGLDLTVLSTKGNQTYAIEVVRMLAKVEFVFMNSSSEDITISKIDMGPLTTVGNTTEGFIPMLWYNDASALSLFTDNDTKYGTETYTHTIASAITVGSGDVSTRPSTSFYVIESNPDPVSKQFNLAFTVSHGSVTDEVRYALLDKSLVQVGTNLDGDDDRSPFIRRNDWLRVPIDLGGYELRLEARSYPPIGGYPEAEIENQTNEFQVKFRYQGDFSIRPALRKYGTTDWIYLDDTSVIDSYTFTVDTTSDGYSNIFSKMPTKKTNEIVGAIKSSTHGTALVTLTINIKISDSVTRTLTRKMYITV